MKENLEFYYNGRLSSELGIININAEGGLFDENVMARRTLLEENVIGRMQPYFLGYEQEPIEFTLAFAFLNSFDTNKIREINTWLNVNYFKEFYFVNEPKYRYFVMPTQDFRLTHNGLGQGYLTVTFKANDVYAYSQEILTDEYDASSNLVTGEPIIITNDGDIPLLAEIWIRKIGDGNVRIVNESDNYKEFFINNLRDNEHVYINNQNEIVQTNIPNLYHMDNMSKEFLALPIGENRLRVFGSCTIQFRYRNKYLISL